MIRLTWMLPKDNPFGFESPSQMMSFPCLDVLTVVNFRAMAMLHGPDTATESVERGLSVRVRRPTWGGSQILCSLRWPDKDCGVNTTTCETSLESFVDVH